MVPGAAPAGAVHAGHDEPGRRPAVTWASACGASVARVVVTDRAVGDLAIGAPPAELAARRRSVVALPWSWMRQVHGTAVHTVDGLVGVAAGVEADAQVTAQTGVALAVQVADCAPVALVSPQGVVGVVHAGWRGTRDGVLGAAVDAMASLGASHIEAFIGPCIHPGCYEFGATDLDAMVGRFGPPVAARTTWGAPALDLPAAVRASLAEAGVTSVVQAPPCTACEPRWFSHRARGDAGRQAMVVWLEPAGGG